MNRQRPVIAVLACLATGSLLTAACSSDENDAPATTTIATATSEGTESAAGTTTTTLEPAVYDIVATALNGKVFTSLAGFVVDAGLVEALREPGPFTVFAPTDEAFAAVPDETMAAVAGDKDLLTTVLTYHVVPGEIALADLQPGPLETLAGVDLEVTREGDTVFINGIEVAAGDVEATNGVIHVMTGVLVPPS